MSTRVWPYPDLRNGTTIHQLTDTHFGARDFSDVWLERTRLNMERLKANHAGHVHTGDMIHNIPNGDTSGDTAVQDANYLSWRAAVKAADPGKPYAEAVGNHDLCRQDPAGSTSITAAQWAAKYGLPSKNTVTVMGDVTVITVGPDDWPWPDATANRSVLSAATLTWLDQQLTAAGSTPCWIAAHAPLLEQYPAAADSMRQWPEVTIASIIGAHSNVIGWLSGHLHSPIESTTNVQAMTVGGRRIFGVNGPPAAGGRLASVDYAGHQWGSPNQSMFVTYLGDAIDVRWIDHNQGRILPDVGGGYARHVLLAA